MFIYLDLIKLIELPETTIILHTRAITGNIVYGTPQIKSIARYVEPPPNPTLEYINAVTKKRIDNIIIFKLWM